MVSKLVKLCKEKNINYWHNNNMLLINNDCNEIMKYIDDKEVCLAITDPPFGIARFGNRVELSNRKYKDAKINKWDIKPDNKYFNELFRISEYQIIWGANNFRLPESEYFIVWDKMQTVDNFASAELAYTNIKQPAKVFRYSIHKEMAERKLHGGKIHPTQKPVALYKWLLHNYAKPDYKIFDSHLGSGSHAIAWHYFSRGKGEFVGIELDKEYFEASKKRIESETNKLISSDKFLNFI